MWRARDVKLERQVALKRPHPVPAGDPRQDRLAREAQLSASISHPHLVTVHDAGSDGDGLFLVMELINAPSLADVKGRLSRERILEIGAQMGRALAAVHRAGVVHRDVKPGNILLADSGAKLTDFGIATNGGPFGAHQPTTPGFFLATANYAAPEVLAGQPATAKSDIFALGVVLHEQLTGRLPFAGADRTQRPATIADPVGPVIDRCLSPYPGERPDGNELAGLLTSALASASPSGPLSPRPVPVGGHDPTATSVMPTVRQPAASSAAPAGPARPPTPREVDPGPAGGGGNRPDSSALVFVALAAGVLFVLFMLVRGAVNNDDGGSETATVDDVTEDGNDDDVELEPDTSVTVPSGGDDAAGDGDSQQDPSAGEAPDEDAGDGDGDDDDGGFGLGGGIIDRLRGVDDMIDSVSEQVEELDAKAKDVRDVMKKINEAVELAGDAKPEEAAKKLEDAARKADDNLDGEARDRVFDLIEDVADQLGVEDVDLDELRDQDD